MAQDQDSSHVTREFCVVYKVEGPKGTKIVRAPSRTQSLATDFNITFIHMLFSNCCIYVAVFRPPHNCSACMVLFYLFELTR